MKDVKKSAQQSKPIPTTLYLKPLPKDGEGPLEFGQTTKSSPRLNLEACTDYIFERDLPAIVATWTTFANIDWLTSKSRDDVELIRANGAQALKRLMPVALRDTNQSKHIAKFLLSLYDWNRFRFDMNDLGCIDHEIFIDCINVLMMNVVPGPEIHEYFEHGNRVFEGMARDWGLKDCTKEM